MLGATLFEAMGVPERTPVPDLMEALKRSLEPECSPVPNCRCVLLTEEDLDVVHDQLTERPD